MKKTTLLIGLSTLFFVYAEAQQKKAQPKKEGTPKQEDTLQVIKSGLSSDPAFVWKTNQDEAQAICSKYRSREEMPGKDLQKVIQLSQADVKYPQYGLYWGDWKEGKKVVESPRGGRFASYGFSDNPMDKGGNCYACHLIEKGVPGGTMGPNLYQYGKRWGVTKENMNTPEGMEKLRAVYNIVYNSWSAFPCSSMPRFGYHGGLSPNDVANIVAFLLHPESPVNK
jgi:sulfur-oxidizing protein SoxX